MKQSIFYSTNFSLKKKKEILNEAHNLCYDWKVDKLDCNISFARQKVEMSFNDILKKLTTKCHFVIINRFRPVDENFLEIGFSTMTGESYYLWIYLDISHLDYFIKKYNLSIL